MDNNFFSVCSDDELENTKSFLLLFSCKSEQWCLYYSSSLDLPKSRTTISDRLDAYLQSARDYPPALAKARVEVSSADYVSPEIFLSAIESAIEKNLTANRATPYFLSRAAKNGGIDFTQDNFYWILGIEGQNVLWVTRDYLIQSLPAEYFCDWDLIQSHFDSGVR